MKRLVSVACALLLIAVWGWVRKSDRPASSSSKAPPLSAIILPLNYIHAASSLAEDDFNKAKDYLVALAREGTGDLQARAQSAADAPDIEAMRENFKALSEVAINRSYPEGYAIAFCPMYKGGARWIQRRDAPIANPYLGKSGPPCGFFVD
jgi:hypothetical protein